MKTFARVVGATAGLAALVAPWLAIPLLAVGIGLYWRDE